jgi:hypothetical protein
MAPATKARWSLDIFRPSLSCEKTLAAAHDGNIAAVGAFTSSRPVAVHPFAATALPEVIH